MIRARFNATTGGKFRRVPLSIGPINARVLIDAFEDILRALKLVNRDDPLRMLLARHIIDLAKAEERDPVRLRDLTLNAIKGL